LFECGTTPPSIPGNFDTKDMFHIGAFCEVIWDLASDARAVEVPLRSPALPFIVLSNVAEMGERKSAASNCFRGRVCFQNSGNRNADGLKTQNFQKP
jgi:hypothetical protein